MRAGQRPTATHCADRCCKLDISADKQQCCYLADLCDAAVAVRPNTGS